MKKKPKSDTAAAAVQAMVGAAAGLPTVPAHVRLREVDRPFWDGIVRARARDDWTEADLVVCAQLARCQADIEAESLTLEGEGTVATNERGTPVVNPRVAVMEQLARREMALMRTLRMGGRVSGDGRDEAGRAKLQAQSRKVRGEIEAENDEEALLA